MNEIQGDNTPGGEKKSEDLSSGNKVNEASGNPADGRKKEDPPCDVKQKSENKPANRYKRWRKHWNKVAAILVQAILAFLTYLLYRQAVNQSGSAIQAAKAADSSVRITRNYDSLSITRQDSILKSNQLEFIAENRPYVQIEVVRAPTFPEIIVKANPTIVYNLRNLGKQPIKIKNGTVWMDYGVNLDTNYFRRRKKFITSENIYLIKEYPDHMTFRSLKALDSTDCKKIKDGKMFIFFYGNLNYLNLLTGSNNSYEFIIKQELAPIEGYDIIYNENTTTNDK